MRRDVWQRHIDISCSAIEKPGGGYDRRTRRACEGCRVRKLKCDGLASCTRCRQRGEACSYSKKRPCSSPQDSPVDELPQAGDYLVLESEYPDSVHAPDLSVQGRTSPTLPPRQNDPCRLLTPPLHSQADPSISSQQSLDSTANDPDIEVIPRDYDQTTTVAGIVFQQGGYESFNSLDSWSLPLEVISNSFYGLRHLLEC